MSIPPTIPKGLLLGKTAEGEYIPILIDERSRRFVLSPESTGLDETPPEEVPTQIVNGDFETPDMDGWEVDATNVTQVTEEDDTVAEFDFTPTETPITEHISQDVDVTDKPALHYSIKGNHGNGEGYGYLAVIVAGDELKTYSDPQDILNWVTEEIDISGYTGKVRIRIETQRDNNSNNGKMKINNMSIGQFRPM